MTHADRNPLADAPEAPRPEPVMPGACRSGGCGGAPPPPMPAPPSFGDVRVNGVEIAPEAIAREIQHHPAPDPESAWTAAAQALAIRELLLQEAGRLGIEATPEPDALGRTETEEDARIAALLELAVVPEEPDEAECRRYYEARQARFRAPELFEVSHVLIEPRGDDDAAWGAAEAEARVIAADVGDDPAAFARAAQAFSACPSAQQEGTLGQVRRGDLVPEIQAAVEALAPGETGREPVRSRFGWHVLRLARRIEGHALPFEAVRERIAEMLAARAWSLASARYLADLAGRADIEGVRIAPAEDPAAGGAAR